MKHASHESVAWWFEQVRVKKKVKQCSTIYRLSERNILELCFIVSCRLAVGASRKLWRQSLVAFHCSHVEHILIQAAFLWSLVWPIIPAFFLMFFCRGVTLHSFFYKNTRHRHLITTSLTLSHYCMRYRPITSYYRPIAPYRIIAPYYRPVALSHYCAAQCVSHYCTLNFFTPVGCSSFFFLFFAWGNSCVLIK